MATAESVELSELHPPAPKSLEAFAVIEAPLKHKLVQLRHHWDKHEPAMFARAARAGLSDEQLTAFNVERDLVAVRTAQTSYGVIIFGKIRVPLSDEEGQAYIHVRIHDPPNRGESDVILHSIYTEEGNRDADGHPTTWTAFMSEKAPIEFFSE